VSTNADILALLNQPYNTTVRTRLQSFLTSDAKMRTTDFNTVLWANGTILVEVIIHTLLACGTQLKEKRMIVPPLL
jgi:hypothetical protein